MASVTSTSLLNGISGTVGPLLVRQYNGRTIVTARARKPQKESELQRLNRVRFRRASHAARTALLHKETKAYYLQKAKKLNYPNAYTAALTDYMRKGSIDQIDVRNYKGNKGNIIRIKSSKNNFTVRDMHLRIVNADGVIVEEGHVFRKSPGEYVYSLQQTHPPKIPITIIVSIQDVMNRISRSVTAVAA